MFQFLVLWVPLDLLVYLDLKDLLEKMDYQDQKEKEEILEKMA
jgi:hypothetical protein